jgi:hypothetical protein
MNGGETGLGAKGGGSGAAADQITTLSVNTQ